MRDRGKHSYDRGRRPRARQGFNRSSREMHKSVCAECGRECEVPFRPTGDRAVYCQECWAKRRPARTQNRRRREYPRENWQNRPAVTTEDVSLQILGELKRIREALEKALAR